MGRKKLDKELISLFIETAKIQHELNLKIDKHYYRNRKEKELQLAILQETSELIDSYAWKWWKKMDNNDLNKKVELVDIYHFLLSWDLFLKRDVEAVGRYVEIHYRNTLMRDFRYKDDFDLIISFVKEVADTRLALAYPYFFGLVNRYFNNDIYEFIRFFFVKNVLNRIRQDSGYKTGSYNKVISGIEDNEIIYKLAEDMDLTDFETFSTELVERFFRHEGFNKSF